MATNLSTRPVGKPRKSGRGKFFLFVFLLIFGGGFYAGIAATKRAVNGPPWIQKIFGLEGTTLVQQPAVAPTPPAMPGATNVSTVPNTPGMPNTGTAPGAPVDDTNPALQKPKGTMPGQPAPATAPPSGTPAAQPAPPQPGSTPANTSKANTPSLQRQIEEYNSILRRVQTAVRDYETAKQATDPQALDRQNNAIDELVAGVQRSQALYDTIHGFPEFAAKYQEMEQAIASSRLPANLPELSVENLKFIRPR